MAYEGIQNLLRGLDQLGQGFEARSEAKLKRARAARQDEESKLNRQKTQLQIDELLNKQKDQQAVAGGIDQTINDLRAKGASPDLINQVQTSLRASGGKNTLDVLNFATKQMSQPAQDRLNQLYGQFVQEQQNGTLDQKKLSQFMDQANVIIKADQLIQGPYKELQQDRDLQKYAKQKEYDLKNAKSLDEFKAGLSLANQNAHYEYTQKLQQQKASLKDLKKAVVPDTFSDKDNFPDGLNDAQVMQKILTMNPDLSQSKQDTLLYVYKNRTTPAGEQPGFIAKQWNAIKNWMFGDELMKVQNNLPQNPKSQPTTTPDDFIKQLDADRGVK